jgi:hypothetical protein
VKVTEIAHEAHVGKCRGSDQHLWERGLWFDKKETPAGTMASMVLTVPKQDERGVRRNGHRCTSSPTYMISISSGKEMH